MIQDSNEPRQFWAGAKPVNVPFEVSCDGRMQNTRNLEAGQKVLLSGVVYTARDAAHKRIVRLLRDMGKPPFDLPGQIIYYAGPCPARPGHVTGSLGPTTSMRMDSYAPIMLDSGIGGIIGKGPVSQDVVSAIVRHRGLYFVAIGGAGALLSTRVKEMKAVAYPELGPEAIYRLVIEEFPVIVGVDTKGRSIYRLSTGRITNSGK